MRIAQYIACSAAGFVIVLAPLLPVFAQTATSDQTATSAPNRRDILEQRKEQQQEHRETIRENVQQQREQVRERLAETRKQLIRGHFTRMMRRFDAALERLRRIGDRIQSRIDKAKANRKDVTTAQATLDRAKASWQEAKSAIDDVKTKLESMLNAEDPKTAFEGVRQFIETARDKVKAAHAAMVGAIKTLKGLGGGDTRATTTPAGTP